MEAVSVSPKFQVVIPRAVREALRIRPGQKIQVIQYEDRLELDTQLALAAAVISTHRRMPMAGSIITASARFYGATLWTQDEHFEQIEGVQFIGK